MPRVPSRSVSLAFAVVASLTLTAASCGDQKSSISLGNAGRGAVVEVVDAPASITARTAATLTAPADGTLASLRVTSGSAVRAGQVVAVLDSPTAQARLEQARRAVTASSRAGRGVGTGGTGGLTRAQRRTDQAAAQAFASARQAAARITDAQVRQALLAQVEAASRQYAAAASTAAQALRAVQRGVAGLGSAVSALSSAQRLQAQQAYELAKSTVDSLTLRTPISGVVQLGGAASGGSSSSLSDLLAAAGTGGTPGAAAPTGEAGGGAAGQSATGVDPAVPQGGRVTAGTPLLTIVDLSGMGLLAEVDETDVLLVSPGVRASVELDAAPGAGYDARVRSVDLLPTPSARGGVSYRVRLDLTIGRYADGRPAPRPRPGMSAVVHLRVREAENGLTVPASAVFSSDGQDTVWAVRGGRARRTPVTVGVQGQDVVQILSGLRDGDRVVVRGTDQVRPGQKLP